MSPGPVLNPSYEQLKLFRRRKSLSDLKMFDDSKEFLGGLLRRGQKLHFLKGAPLDSCRGATKDATFTTNRNTRVSSYIHGTMYMVSNQNTCIFWRGLSIYRTLTSLMSLEILRLKGTSIAFFQYPTLAQKSLKKRYSYSI